MNPTVIHPKVSAAAVAGVFTTLVVYGFKLAGVEIPQEVATAITTLVAFAAGYFTSSV